MLWPDHSGPLADWGCPNLRCLPAAEDHASDDDLELEDESNYAADPAFAEIDALLVRTRKKLDDWNDLSSDEGRKNLTLHDPAYNAVGRFEHWLAILEEGRGLPAALAAALTLDAWLALEPSERAGELGFALAATVLRQRGLTQVHLPTLGLGLRRRRFRWSPHLTLPMRIGGYSVRSRKQRRSLRPIAIAWRSRGN